MLVNLLDFSIYGIKVVQMFLSFTTAILIKLGLDRVTVSRVVKMLLKRKHGSKAPVGALDAFRYLYKAELKKKWYYIITAVVVTVVIEFRVFDTAWYLYLIMYIFLAIATQLIAAERVYRLTED